MKARANKLRISGDDSIQVSQRTPKNHTLDHSVSSMRQSAQLDMSGSVMIESDWTELTRQQVTIEGNYHDAVLLAKN